MAGYANRTLRLEFPDLSEDGEDVHVIMRNPKTVPPSMLRVTGVPEGDEEAAEQAGYTVMSRLIVAWHVYDAAQNGKNQDRLPLPATAELVEKLPLGIIEALAEKVGQATGAVPLDRATPPTTTS
jgi:hypothetical protein